MKRIIPIIYIFVSLALWLPIARGATFGDLGPYFSFTYGDGGGIPADVHNVTGQQTSPDGQRVKMFGDLGPIDGARFASGFVIYWSGGFQGPITPGDKFLADLNFNVNATGGALEWSFFADIWSNEGYERARILTDLMPMPASGQISGVHLESSPFTEYGETGYFEGYLHIGWAGFSPTDTFSISIPQNSIDITYVPVPEPGTLALALTGLTFMAMLRPSHRPTGRARR